MSLQPHEIANQGGGFTDHLLKELGQTGPVVFVLVVDDVAQFPDQLSVIGRVDDLQPLHVRKYRAEAFHVLFFFDGD